MPDWKVRQFGGGYGSLACTAMLAPIILIMPPGDWLYEVKFDGYRALALRGGSETRILS
jgi:ATP-dependent DNA ligase